MASGLATRCPACGTVFRVVLDLLRVSEGWVRCGRCSDVFNAAETLVDLESGAARPVVFDTSAAGPAPAPVVQMHDSVVEDDAPPPVIEEAAAVQIEDHEPVAALLSAESVEPATTASPA